MIRSSRRFTADATRWWCRGWGSDRLRQRDCHRCRPASGVGLIASAIRSTRPVSLPPNSPTASITCCSQLALIYSDRPMLILSVRGQSTRRCVAAEAASASASSWSSPMAMVYSARSYTADK
jgi:hypothetical protein